MTTKPVRGETLTLKCSPGVAEFCAIQTSGIHVGPSLFGANVTLMAANPQLVSCVLVLSPKEADSLALILRRQARAARDLATSTNPKRPR